MTETDHQDAGAATADQPTEEFLTDAVSAAPFLRITGTFPAPDGRVETISVELNLVEGLPGGDGPADTAARTWFTDLCTCVVASLRRGEPLSDIVLTGPTSPGTSPPFDNGGVLPCGTGPADQTGGA